MTDLSNTTSAEDVNTETTITDTGTEEFKVSKEEYEKIKELETNKSIALKQEREEKQALKDKLAEFERAEQERLEKKKKEQGKYEELLAEKEAKVAELTEKATAYDVLQAKLTEQKEQELNSLLEKIPTALQEKYQSITSKLDLEDTVLFYKNIMEDYEKKDFDTNPKKEGKEIKGEESPKQ